MADEGVRDGNDEEREPGPVTGSAPAASDSGGESAPGEGRGPAEDDAGTTAGHTGPGGPATGSSAPVSPDELTDAVRGAIADLPPEKRNQFVPGTLTVHYGERDVGFQMDGESALRMLAVLAGTSNDVDEIRRSSDALRGWLMIDRTSVLGAQWTPTEATVPRRPTMDPGGLLDTL